MQSRNESPRNQSQWHSESNAKVDDARDDCHGRGDKDESRSIVKKLPFTRRFELSHCSRNDYEADHKYQDAADGNTSENQN